jgi:hypothetical protein
MRVLVEAALSLIGLALTYAGVAVSQAWIQAHFLPHFSLSAAERSARENFARLLLVVLGLAIMLCARRVRRLATRAAVLNATASAARISVAIVLALGTGEILLQVLPLRAFDPFCCGREPLRQPDELLGWVPTPNRTGRITVAGREVEYAIDAAGNRVSGLAEPTDPEAPTILFAGESFMFGYQLPWNETIPAQVAALTGYQTANLAVNGYSDAQAYLRLADQLPRFRAPVAIVFLFLPSVFYKNLDRTRPRLDAALQRLPQETPWRLGLLVHRLLPYDSSAEIEDGVRTSRAILRAVAELARDRGAASLAIVPQFVPEDPGERAVRERVLDEAGLPYVVVALQQEWHVPEDPHPDKRANGAMARAIVRELEKQGVVMPAHRRPMVMNSPPSCPRDEIHPSCVSQRSSHQLSPAGAKRFCVGLAISELG